MTDHSLLYRQINPGFIELDRIQSPAFKPTKKDAAKLSVDDGEQTSAEDSWSRFTGVPDCRSAGVMAVTYSECKACGLPAAIDGDPYTSHGFIDFTSLSRGQTESKSKLLRDAACVRGWQYQPTASAE